MHGPPSWYDTIFAVLCPGLACEQQHDQRTVDLVLPQAAHLVSPGGRHQEELLLPT